MTEPQFLSSCHIVRVASLVLSDGCFSMMAIFEGGWPEIEDCCSFIPARIAGLFRSEDSGMRSELDQECCYPIAAPQPLPAVLDTFAFHIHPSLAAKSLIYFRVKEDFLKRLLMFVIFACLEFSTPAHAQRAVYSQQPQQQFDIGFGVGTVVASSGSSFTSSHSPQSLGGGAYLNFSGDYIFWRGVGLGGEVAWRASQNLYGGYQPFRPIFYDFNAVYAPSLGRRAQLVLLGGLGGLSTRFYTQTYFCNYSTCTNYVDSNHFMGDLGAGIRLFVDKGVFLQPEFREYFIHNNVEIQQRVRHALRSHGWLFVWSLVEEMS